MRSYNIAGTESHRLLQASFGLFFAFMLVATLFLGACSSTEESISPEQAYDELTSRSKDMHLLESAFDLGGWDQEICMPLSGSESRSDMMAYLQQLHHNILSDPRFGELLAIAKSGTWPPDKSANIREWQRQYDVETKLPGEFVTRFAQITSQAYEYWTRAREQNDFSIVAPTLKEVVQATREKANYLGWSEEPYEVLVDEFEPGMTVKQYEEMFSELKKVIVPLLQIINESTIQNNEDLFAGASFPIDTQEEFIIKITKAIGFDYDAGRLDTTAHPFTTRIGPGDVRITNRYPGNNFFDPIHFTLHEAGHGIYFQGLPSEYYGTPMGDAISYGIHESQSRFYENNICRSRPFWEYWFPELQETFGANVSSIDFEEFYRFINQVKPSLIRVEADEVTYNLHIIIRFELERELINGTIEVDDLPQLWREKYKEYLGVDVPDDYSGILQDIQWFEGSFGYFPTYALGTVCAAQLEAALRADAPDLDEQLRKGDFSVLLDWLHNNVHQYGSLYLPAELIEHATGKPLSAEDYINYLTQKYNDIYELAVIESPSGG